MVKRKTDSAAARANQSAKTLEEVIPIGNRNVKPSLQGLVKLR